ncbi:MAG: peptidylprolyl isomerase [Candidatus Bathyarchaeum sp.]|nr:MAG: peptidylprolyl isomerase [Candidatus Bathyarchaeum sp.]
MPIQKSDFIIVDYTGKVKETGEVFDTTSEEIAKENKLYKEGDLYEPRLVVAGEGWLLKALDEALLTFKLKKKETVEIPPEKAFGNREPEKVKLVPIRRLAARGITPRLGAQIEYDKRLATVRTIGSGRVTLDFNPPLAGKTLVYEVTINKKLTTNEEKVSALIHRRVSAVEVEKFDFKIGKANVTVNMPDESFYVEGIQLAKRGIAMDIQRFVPELTTVQFVESFVKPEAAGAAKKEAKKKPVKKAVKKPAAKKTEEKPEKKTKAVSEKKPAKKAEAKTTKTTKKAVAKTATKKPTKKAAKETS